MAFNKTIGIIGYNQDNWEERVKLLAKEYRLLLFPLENNPDEQYPWEIPGHNLGAEVEFVDCAKEGCWEADLVIIEGMKADIPLLKKNKGSCHTKSCSRDWGWGR